MLRFFKFCLFVVLFLTAALTAVLIACFERHPKYELDASPNSYDYATIGAFAKELLKIKKNRLNPSTLNVSGSELTSIERVATQQLSRIIMRADLQQRRIKVGGSIKVSEGFWLNLSAEQASGSSIALQEIRAGRLPIPDALGSSFIDAALQYALKTDTDAINAYVSKIEITESHLSVVYNPALFSIVDISALFGTYKQLAGNSIDVDTSLIAYYRDIALSLAANSPSAKKQQHSLAVYLDTLLRHEIQYSDELITKSQQETEEHALLALASLSGLKFLNNALQIQPTRRRAYIHFTLNKRADLAKHFLASAAIKIVSDKTTSISIGEAKELLDSKADGSGFSFQDLAADRAGVYFSQRLSQKSSEAFIVRNTLLTEAHFFPNITELREGLSEKEFKQDYRSTDSPEYKAVLTRINREIEKLAFFNNAF